MSKKSLKDELLNYLRKQTKTPAIQYTQPPNQLTVGKETKIYEFKIKNQSTSIPNKLILRMLPTAYRPYQAKLTGTLHNYLNSQGYPTPKVYFMSNIDTLQGSQFLIMDYVRGKMAYESASSKTPQQIAEVCHRLHQIDPNPLIEKYRDFDVPESRYKGWGLEYVETNAPWLKTAQKWVVENYPVDSVKLCICHGEFHPLNVIVDDGCVVGVLDWSTFRIEDRHYDLAFLRNLSGSALPYYYSGYDWDGFFSDFIEAYRLLGGLDEAVFEYFIAYVSFVMFIIGLRFKAAMYKPEIMSFLSESFEKITHIPLHDNNR